MGIYYLITVASVMMETGKNIMSNAFSKKTLKNSADVYKFNTVMYAGALAVLLVILAVKGTAFSWYSCGMAALFALVSGEMQASFLRALQHGPLSYIDFIQTSGLVIPALFGSLFLDQPITPVQILALPVLLVSLVLVMDLRRGEKGNGRWLLSACISMLCSGFVGVVQSLHQSSAHADEIYGFLAMTFVFIVVMNLIPWRMAERKEASGFSLREKAALHPLVSGLFMGVVNVVNLFLIGVMPTVLFFPLANGGLLIMTMLAAVLFFRERLKPKQWFGIAIGTAALYLLGA